MTGETPPGAGTLRILSGGAAHGLVAALAPAFTAATGWTIDGDYGAVGGMRQRIMAGERPDVVILTAAILAELEAGGIVTAGSAQALGTVTTAVAVRAGDTPPPMATSADLRAALLAADAIYFPDPELATAGIHVQSVLVALGILDEVRNRLRTFPNGATAMKALAAAPERNPIGSTQTTEILSTPGLTLLGDLPAPHGLATTYTAGVIPSVAGEDADARAQAAVALVALLAAPASATTRQRCGFR